MLIGVVARSFLYRHIVKSIGMGSSFGRRGAPEHCSIAKFWQTGPGGTAKALSFLPRAPRQALEGSVPLQQYASDRFTSG